VARRQSLLALRDSCSDESNDILKRERKCFTESAQGAEGRSPATCEEVTECSLIDLGVLRKVVTRPAPQDPSSFDRVDVDGPFDAGASSSQCGLNAMEGTVLRVPCIPPKRWRGFWRSSVRGPGPPVANCSRFSDRRRRA